MEETVNNSLWTTTMALGAAAQDPYVNATNCSSRDELMKSDIVRAMFVMLYGVVFAVAVSGNLLVLYVVVRNKKMQTVTNIFISNLALSDLFVNFTSLWLTPAYAFAERWLWGSYVCHAFSLFQGASISISTMTLTAIAIDRYIVIVKSSSSANVGDRISMTKCFVIVVAIWCFSLLFMTPYALHMTLEYIPECDIHICSEKWNYPELRTIFGTTVFLCQFVLPFAVIGISYRRIWTFLENRTWASERTIETSRKKRLLSMLILMVFLFAVCWFPVNAFNALLRDTEMIPRYVHEHFLFFYLMTHVICMTTTCWNPIIYAWMNDAFREEFIRALPILRTRFKAVPRVKMISECVPASKRANCKDSATMTKIRSKSIGDGGAAVETFLLSDKAGNAELI